MSNYLYLKEPKETPIEKQRRLMGEAAEQVRQSEIAEGKQPESAPTEQVETKPSADDILDEVNKAKTDEDKLSVLEQHGVDTSQGWDDWESLEADVQKIVVKSEKQAAVGPQSVVGQAGTTPTPTIGDAESIQSELSRLMSSGRMTDPKVARRVRELTAKLNELDPPRIVT